MLSVLIPIYNFNIVSLVNDLHQQANECGIQFEIVCFDDASESSFKNQNQFISSLPNVKYLELPDNIGRSKIRNRLAEVSMYDNLLFLDCDSSLPSKNFIKKYIIHIENYHVVYGGRVYDNAPPLSQKKYFRWFYGKKRESYTVDQRAGSPFKSFMTNNFLIKKKAFLSIRLNENIIGYGHEDTMFGIRLKENNVLIKHINNPVVHVGLEDFDEYIEKTLQGLKNLLFISLSVEMRDTVRLYRFLMLTKKYKLESAVQFFGKLLEKRMLKNLSGSSPILLFFDFFKLSNIIRMQSSVQKNPG